LALCSLGVSFLWSGLFYLSNKGHESNDGLESDNAEAVQNADQF
jgi:hypothetical protein